jgi:hypothetical protein
MFDMNKLSRIIGIAPLTVVLASTFIAGCGAEAQDESEPSVLPEAPGATTKAPCCQGCGTPPPICNQPLCFPGSTNPLCTNPPPPPATTAVYVDSQGNLKIQAGSNQANLIGVTEPVNFVLEINDNSANVLDPGGTSCWFPTAGNPRLVRCNVPWHAKIYANLGDLSDGFWSTTPRQTLVNGGSGNDTIGTGAALDWLVGDAGNDTLSGGGGDDVLLGAGDFDTVDGQAGNDTCTAEVEANCEL